MHDHHDGGILHRRSIEEVRDRLAVKGRDRLELGCHQLGRDDLVHRQQRNRCALTDVDARRGHRRGGRRIAEQRGRAVRGEVRPGNQRQAETCTQAGQRDVPDMREADTVPQLQAGDRILGMEDEDASPVEAEGCLAVPFCLQNVAPARAPNVIKCDRRDVPAGIGAEQESRRVGDTRLERPLRPVHRAPRQCARRRSRGRRAAGRR